MLFYETDKIRSVKSKEYNSFFDKENGLFARWGKTKEDDPKFAPMPEILDLEISNGQCMGMCDECYKRNGAVKETYNMSFEDFRNVFHKVARTVIEVKFKNEEKPLIKKISDELSLYKDCSTKQDIINKQYLVYDKNYISSIRIYNVGLLQQIAFGLTNIGSNPDFFKMMRYCREFDVIPNYTCHGLDMNEDYAKLSAELCGAVAVSVYNKEKSYNAVKMLSEAGVKQVNFHCIAHDKSYDKILSIIDDIKSGERLKNIRALVLLKYKPKGNGVGKFNHLTIDQYRNIIKYAEDNGVTIGFDSCSAHSYLKAIEDKPQDLYKKLEQMVEPCESGCFSSYINDKGCFYACSFCEGEGMWKEGINVLECNDFVQDVWNNPKTQKFRDILLKNCRRCPMYNLD